MVIAMDIDISAWVSLLPVEKILACFYSVTAPIVQFIVRFPIVCLVNSLLFLFHLYMVKCRTVRPRNQWSMNPLPPAPSQRLTSARSAHRLGQICRNKQVNTRERHPQHDRKAEPSTNLGKRTEVNPGVDSNVMPMKLTSHNLRHLSYEQRARARASTDEDETSTLNEVTWTNEASSVQFKVGTLRLPVDKLSDVAEETEITSSPKGNNEGQEEEGVGSCWDVINLTLGETSVVEHTNKMSTVDAEVGKAGGQCSNENSPVRAAKNARSIVWKDVQQEKKARGRKSRSRQKKGKNCKSNYTTPRSPIDKAEKQATCNERSRGDSFDRHRASSLARGERLSPAGLQKRDGSASPGAESSPTCRKAGRLSPCKRQAHVTGSGEGPKGGTTRASREECHASSSNPSPAEAAILSASRGDKWRATSRCRLKVDSTRGRDCGGRGGGGRDNRTKRPKSTSPNAGLSTVTRSPRGTERNWNSMTTDASKSEDPPVTVTRNTSTGNQNCPALQPQEGDTDTGIDARPMPGKYSSGRQAKNCYKPMFDQGPAKRKGVPGILGWQLTRGDNGQRRCRNQRWHRQTMRRQQLQPEQVVESATDLQQGCPSGASSYSCCSSGGGNRSEATPVGRRDSWIWFSHETRPSVENFVTRQHRFRSQDPRVAELAAEIRRQDELNRAIEQEAGSIVATPCLLLQPAYPSKAVPGLGYATLNDGGVNNWSIQPQAWDDPSRKPVNVELPEGELITQGGQREVEGRRLSGQGEVQEAGGGTISKQGGRREAGGGESFGRPGGWQDVEAGRPSEQGSRRKVDRGRHGGQGGRQVLFGGRFGGQGGRREVTGRRLCGQNERRKVIGGRLYGQSGFFGKEDERQELEGGTSSKQDELREVERLWDSLQEEEGGKGVQPEVGGEKRSAQDDHLELGGGRQEADEGWQEIEEAIPIIQGELQEIEGGQWNGDNRRLKVEGFRPGGQSDRPEVDNCPSFPGVLLVSPIRSSSTSSHHSTLAHAQEDGTRGDILSCNNAPERGQKPPKEHEQRSVFPSCSLYDVLSHRPPLSPRSLPWDDISCASTKASTSSLLAPQMHNRLYPAALSPPKTCNHETNTRPCGHNTVVCAAHATQIVDQATTSSVQENNQTEEKMRSPHTQSLTTSTQESSDSQVRQTSQERLSDIRQVVIDNEVKDSVCKMLFDTEHSTSSNSPPKPNSLGRAEMRRAALNQPNNSSNRTPQNSPGNTNKCRKRRSNTPINVFTRDYYLGKRAMQRAAATRSASVSAIGKSTTSGTTNVPLSAPSIPLSPSLTGAALSIPQPCKAVVSISSSVSGIAPASPPVPGRVDTYQAWPRSLSIDEEAPVKMHQRARSASADSSRQVSRSENNNSMSQILIGKLQRLRDNGKYEATSTPAKQACLSKSVYPLVYRNNDTGEDGTAVRAPTKTRQSEKETAGNGKYLRLKSNKQSESTPPHGLDPLTHGIKSYLPTQSTEDAQSEGILNVMQPFLLDIDWDQQDDNHHDRTQAMANSPELAANICFDVSDLPAERAKDHQDNHTKSPRPQETLPKARHSEICAPQSLKDTNDLNYIKNDLGKKQSRKNGLVELKAPNKFENRDCPQLLSAECIGSPKTKQSDITSKHLQLETEPEAEERVKERSKRDLPHLSVQCKSSDFPRARVRRFKRHVRSAAEADGTMVEHRGSRASMHPEQEKGVKPLRSCHESLGSGQESDVPSLSSIARNDRVIRASSEEAQKPTRTNKSTWPLLGKRHVPMSTLIADIPILSLSQLTGSGFSCHSSPASSLGEKVNDVSLKRRCPKISKETLFTPDLTQKGEMVKSQSLNVSHLRKTRNFYGKDQMRITRAVGLIHRQIPAKPEPQPIDSCHHNGGENTAPSDNDTNVGNLEHADTLATFDSHDKQLPHTGASLMLVVNSRRVGKVCMANSPDKLLDPGGDLVTLDHTDNVLHPELVSTSFHLGRDGEMGSSTNNSSSSSQHVTARRDVLYTTKASPTMLHLTADQEAIRTREIRKTGCADVYSVDQSHMEMPLMMWMEDKSKHLSRTHHGVVSLFQPLGASTGDSRCSGDGCSANATAMVCESKVMPRLRVLQCRQNVSSILRREHALGRSQSGLSLRSALPDSGEGSYCERWKHKTRTARARIRNNTAPYARLAYKCDSISGSGQVVHTTPSLQSVTAPQKDLYVNQIQHTLSDTRKHPHTSGVDCEIRGTTAGVPTTGDRPALGQSFHDSTTNENARPTAGSPLEAPVGDYIETNKGLSLEVLVCDHNDAISEDSPETPVSDHEDAIGRLPRDISPDDNTVAISERLLEATPTDYEVIIGELTSQPPLTDHGEAIGNVSLEGPHDNHKTTIEEISLAQPSRDCDETIVEISVEELGGDVDLESSGKNRIKVFHCDPKTAEKDVLSVATHKFEHYGSNPDSGYDEGISASEPSRSSISPQPIPLACLDDLPRLKTTVETIKDAGDVPCPHDNVTYTISKEPGSVTNYGPSVHEVNSDDDKEDDLAQRSEGEYLSNDSSIASMDSELIFVSRSDSANPDASFCFRPTQEFRSINKEGTYSDRYKHDIQNINADDTTSYRSKQDNINDEDVSGARSEQYSKKINLEARTKQKIQSHNFHTSPTANCVQDMLIVNFDKSPNTKSKPLVHNNNFDTSPAAKLEGDVPKAHSDDVLTVRFRPEQDRMKPKDCPTAISRQDEEKKHAETGSLLTVDANLGGSVLSASKSDACEEQDLSTEEYNEEGIITIATSPRLDEPQSTPQVTSLTHGVTKCAGQNTPPIECFCMYNTASCDCKLGLSLTYDSGSTDGWDDFDWSISTDSSGLGDDRGCDPMDSLNPHTGVSKSKEIVEGQLDSVSQHPVTDECSEGSLLAHKTTEGRFLNKTFEKEEEELTINEYLTRTHVIDDETYALSVSLPATSSDEENEVLPPGQDISGESDNMPQDQSLEKFTSLELPETKGLWSQRYRLSGAEKETLSPMPDVDIEGNATSDRQRIVLSETTTCREGQPMCTTSRSDEKGILVSPRTLHIDGPEKTQAQKRAIIRKRSMAFQDLLKRF